MIALVFCMVAFHRYVHFGSQDLEGGNILHCYLQRPMQVSTMSPIYQGHKDRGIQVLVDARLWFRRHVIGINVWPPDVSRIKRTSMEEMSSWNANGPAYMSVNLQFLVGIEGRVPLAKYLQYSSSFGIDCKSIIQYFASHCARTYLIYFSFYSNGLLHLKTMIHTSGPRRKF